MGCVKRREALCALFMAAAPEGERAPDTLQHDPIHNNPHATTQAQQGKAEREGGKDQPAIKRANEEEEKKVQRDKIRKTTIHRDWVPKGKKERSHRAREKENVRAKPGPRNGQ